MLTRSTAAALAALALLACEESGPEPEPPNVYLDRIVIEEWNPGVAGAAARNIPGLIGEDGVPVMNDCALGPPEGTGSRVTSNDATAVGVGGSAAWGFREGWYVHDGPGPDFMTFQNSFAWGGQVDGLVCELAHVEVSEDLEHWYYNAAATWVENPRPEEDDDGYVHAAVSGLHGNNPTWANHTKAMQAQEIRDGAWVDIPDVFVPPDFGPGDPHLGGDLFDLADFRSLEDDDPWPLSGRMRYIRIVDDPRILDGQDYLKLWNLGSQMHAAMGINVREEG